LTIHYSSQMPDDSGRPLRYTIHADAGLVPTGQSIRLIDDIKAALAAEAASWHKDELHTTAKVCEKIRYTGERTDYVSLSLTDKNGGDGGYLHVFGWKVAEF